MGKLLIQINNWRSRRKKGRFGPREILVLVPNCLQRSACEVNLRNDVADCRRCGTCNVGAIVEVAEELDVPVAMAAGGREAARRVRQPEVKAVVAVACSKELNEGVKSTFPKPVISIENLRPHGPCKDTRVDVEEIRRAVNWFLKSR